MCVCVCVCGGGGGGGGGRLRPDVAYNWRRLKMGGGVITGILLYLNTIY